MIDKEKFAKIINDLEAYLKKLTELQKYNLKPFLSDWKIHDLVERNLQLAIQTTLDLGEMIISEFNFKKPDSYKDIARILAENKVIPFDFQPILEDLAGFRNVLVYEYLYLDREKVYEHLQKDLEKIRKFIKQIKEFIKSKNKKTSRGQRAL